LLDVLDVRFSGIQQVNLSGIGVESRDAVPGFRKTQRERQAHVTATDNRYLKLRTFKKFWFPIDGHELKRAPRKLPAPQRSEKKSCADGDRTLGRATGQQAGVTTMERMLAVYRAREKWGVMGVLQIVLPRLPRAGAQRKMVAGCFCGCRAPEFYD
jgi:hypothetical protein